MGGADPRALEAAEGRLDALFAPRADARPVYPDGALYPHGYVDDPRNTDDAWVATRVFHFHLPGDVGDLLDIDPRPPGEAPCVNCTSATTVPSAARQHPSLGEATGSSGPTAAWS